MTFILKYHEKVASEDIPKLSAVDKKRVKKTIENKLQRGPEVFGIPLRKSLKGYKKLRVGDYRVIFKVENLIVKILVIQHRSVVYKISEKRIT